MQDHARAIAAMPIVAAPDRRRYRIEHRRDGAAWVVGDDPCAFPTIAADLAAAGSGGELVVVEVATGADLLRRRLAPRRNPGRARQLDLRRRRH